MITSNERKALQAIVDSEYHDGSNPVDHDVWTQCCNPFANKRTQSGVYASLSKKGFIRVGDYDMGDRHGTMGTVAITAAGFNALNSKSQRSTPKEKQMKNVKAIKSTKSTSKAAQQHAFRVILRGTKVKGKKEIRVRHVFTTPARNEGDAVEVAQPKVTALIKKEGLKNEYLSVLPPLSKAA